MKHPDIFLIPAYLSWPGKRLTETIVIFYLNCEDECMNKRSSIAAILIALMVAFSFSPAMAAAKPDTSKTATTETKAVASVKVNINTADVTQLTEIPGIGPKTAEAIVAYRKNVGQFKTLEDLIEVKGIGLKKLEKMRPYLEKI
jgi:competence protein ComEA